MKHCKAHTESLSRLEEVADIGARIVAASRASAFLGNGSSVLGIFFIKKVYFTLPGEEVTVTGVTAGHNAVEEIYPSVYCFNDVLGCSYTHKIPGLVLGHIGFNGFDNVVHYVSLLAYGETAYGIAVAPHLFNFLHILNTEVLVGAALVNAEKKLVGVNRSLLCIKSVKFCAATLQPANGALLRCFNVVIGRRVLHAFVKSHSYG